MSFTNFCTRSGGDNLAAGTRKGDTTEPGTSPSFTYAGGTFVRSSRTFTCASENPSGDGVVAGDYASIYTTSGATVATYIGRVSSVTTSTVVIDATAICGVATSVSESAAAATCKIGGAWAGPAAGSGFPLSFLTNVPKNSSGHPVRLNMKNDATYSISTGITAVGETTIEGYTSAYGDGGRATIDGSTNAIVLLTQTTNRSIVKNIIVSNNGSSGSNSGLVCQTAIGCVANNIRGFGIAASQIALWCEAYACNTSNTSNLAGFSLASTGSVCVKCYSHDHAAGTNAHGFLSAAFNMLIDCIADTCGGHGLKKFSSASAVVINCDFYNNTGDGIDQPSSSGFLWVENSNFVKNGAYGIHAYNTAYPTFVQNCGFGSGTQINTSGATTGADLQDLGTSVTYGSNLTPYNAPTTGDFRIALATAKNAGFGAFTQTDGTNTGTVAYPDIGVGQHVDSGGGGGAAMLINGGLVQ